MFRFDTATVPQAQRLHALQAAIRKSFGVNVDIVPENRQSRICAAMTLRRAGELLMADISGESWGMVRQCGQQGAGPDARSFWAILQLEGGCTVEQRGHVVTLGPGDLVLIDMMQPASACYGEGAHQLLLSGPCVPGMARPGMPMPLTMVRLDTRRGIGAVVGSFLRMVNEQLDFLDVESTAVLVEQAMRLLALAFGQPSLPHDVEPPSVNHERLRRILAYIDAHLAEPDLSPARVAAANRVSLRYLHKLFASTEHSVSAWIRERRLARCAEALASPAQASRSICEIAYTTGFGDLSHFCRAFKNRFGVTPRAYRQAPPGHLVHCGLDGHQEREE